jgi:protein-L-isoaspartate(D-aspartate) O-methyltransferase
MGRSLFSLIAFLSICGDAAAASQNLVDQQRTRMIATIRNIAATSGLGDHRNLDPVVLEAMNEVPRHLFVPEEQRSSAYDNRPLPIGHGQTISQPYIVALMTHLLRLKKSDVVLEVGTGSGYQAAVLSKLVERVYTIEIVAPLAREAEERLRLLGYRNVTVRRGDGYAGWPEQAPFDGIIVTAGAKKVPRPLLGQLKSGGRMVLPIGSSWTGQKLLLIEKQPDGQILTRNMGDVLFVPMTGAARER